MVHVGSTFSGISFINGYHGRSQDFSKGGGGGYTVSNRGYSRFRNLNIVGCLSKKRLTEGGSRAPQDPPPLATPLVIDKSPLPKNKNLVWRFVPISIRKMSILTKFWGKINSRPNDVPN